MNRCTSIILSTTVHTLFTTSLLLAYASRSDSAIATHATALDVLSRYSRQMEFTVKDTEKVVYDWPPPPGLFQYELVNVTEVAGRQGITAEGEYYYVSGSAALYKYDRDWNLVLANEDIFSAGLEFPANHAGDISILHGEIYAGIEWFENGQGKDIQIAVYDATTLNFIRSFPFDATSGQIEVSGIAVDAPGNAVWMTEWNRGDYVYRYDLGGNYTGKVHLRPSPQWPQGIAIYNGNLIFTSDDGNADRKEYDNLWSYPAINTGKLNYTYVRYEMTLDDVLDYGEIEGLDYDEDQGLLLVVHNRGRQIVLGTPMEFYPGYDREIHEVYTYKISPKPASAMHDSDNMGVASSDTLLLAPAIYTLASIADVLNLLVSL